MEFEKFEHMKKPLHVANQVLRAIKEGDLGVGDKLPTEEELAKKTGVSRASVREALSALRLGGIIKTTVGKGTFVSKVPETDSIKEHIQEIFIDSSKPIELQEARAAFEIGIVKVAARRLTDKNEKEFEEILEEMSFAVERNDYERFLALHKQFHLQIAKATNNEVIEDTLRNLQGIMNENVWHKLEEIHYLPDKRDYLLESVKIHNNIFVALKQHNPKLVKERIEAHFKRYA